MTTCDICGKTYEAPEWPWCPHGRGSYAWRFGENEQAERTLAHGYSSELYEVNKATGSVGKPIRADGARQRLYNIGKNGT